MSLGIPIALEAPLAVVMVGLPARGKTYIAQKLARYVAWLGYSAKVFNVGNYRRERFGAAVHHSFFDPDNAEGMASRHEAAMTALDDLLAWFQDGGQVGVYDATNNTRVELLASANGTARPSECPKVGLVPAVAAGSPCRP